MEEAELKEKLVVLSRILYKEEFLDSFGHVSVRIPGKDYYYITRGGPSGKGDFGTQDLVCVDFQGKKVGGDGQPPIESIIHTALHRTREDAVCIVHVHPYYAKLFTIAGIKFQPVTLQAAIFGFDLPVYEPADLIITEAEGEELVRLAGAAKAVLLRSHGVVTIGDSIEEAFFLTYHLEESIHLLIDAIRLGKVIPLSNEEVQKRLDSAARTRNSGVSTYAKVWTYHEYKTRI
jgi:ribulose-5-phosphate 4-epimerase/fuculose-1-phosphate aldolase